MNVSTLWFQLSRVLMLAAVVLPLSGRFAARANAGIINDAVITGSVQSALTSHYSTNGELNVTHSDAPLSSASAHLEAQSTTGGNKIRITSFGTSFSHIWLGVVDFYTVTGGTPGEQISFNGHYRTVGNSQTIDISSISSNSTFIGEASITGLVGFGLDANGAATAGNPVITDGGGLGRVSQTVNPFGLATSFVSVDFDFDVVIPLTVTVGQQFQLSFSNRVFHTASVLTDMFDTAIAASICRQG